MTLGPGEGVGGAVGHGGRGEEQAPAHEKWRQQWLWQLQQHQYVQHQHPFCVRVLCEEGHAAAAVKDELLDMVHACWVV